MIRRTATRRLAALLVAAPLALAGCAGGEEVEQPGGVEQEGVEQEQEGGGLEGGVEGGVEGEVEGEGD